MEAVTVRHDGLLKLCSQGLCSFWISLFLFSLTPESDDFLPFEYV